MLVMCDVKSVDLDNPYHNKLSSYFFLSNKIDPERTWRKQKLTKKILKKTKRSLTIDIDMTLFLFIWFSLLVLLLLHFSLCYIIIAIIPTRVLCCFFFFKRRFHSGKIIIIIEKKVLVIYFWVVFVFKHIVFSSFLFFQNSWYF